VFEKLGRCFAAHDVVQLRQTGVTPLAAPPSASTVLSGWIMTPIRIGVDGVVELVYGVVELVYDGCTKVERCCKQSTHRQPS
jgi:hypothetical protein